MSGAVKLTAPELLQGALAFVEFPHAPDVEPEPLERFALVLGLLADELTHEHPGLRALAALRLAVAQLWTDAERTQVARLAAPAPVLVRRAELREEACHE